jgi:hypothetical protein
MKQGPKHDFPQERTDHCVDSWRISRNPLGTPRPRGGQQSNPQGPTPCKPGDRPVGSPPREGSRGQWVVWFTYSVLSDSGLSGVYEGRGPLKFFSSSCRGQRVLRLRQRRLHGGAGDRLRVPDLSVDALRSLRHPRREQRRARHRRCRALGGGRLRHPACVQHAVSGRQHQPCARGRVRRARLRRRHRGVQRASRRMRLGYQLGRGAADPGPQRARLRQRRLQPAGRPKWLAAARGLRFGGALGHEQHPGAGQSRYQPATARQRRVERPAVASARDRGPRGGLPGEKPDLQRHAVRRRPTPSTPSSPTWSTRPRATSARCPPATCTQRRPTATRPIS